MCKKLSPFISKFNLSIFLLFLIFFTSSCYHTTSSSGRSSKYKNPSRTTYDSVQEEEVSAGGNSDGFAKTANGGNEKDTLSDILAQGGDNSENKTSANGNDSGQRQENMDEALELLGQSQEFWEKGDLDNALNLLDDAYSMVLSVNGDPNVSWQKDDLRFIIAKRILEIYTSRSNVAVGHQSEIPLIMNSDVEKEIKRFQNSERSFFIRSYKRSGKYRSIIVEQLRQAGLPEELSWLPLVESGFNVKAFSRARALGLWQFIPSTGYKYGLKRDYWVDERMDVEKSTKAAIAYLKQLHEIFGDWLTVLAAYNCGEGRVLKVISRQHMNYLDNFWDLYRQLPSETSRYVPRFIATLHIIKNPGKYGMDLGEGLDECVPYETVEVNKCMKLTDVARNLSVSEDTLVFLNSELRYKTTPDKEYDLKIPSGTKNRFMVVVNEIPKSKRPGGPEFVRHKVKKGEALSTIARRYKSSVKAIMAANHITSKHKIRAGNWIKVPVKGYSSYNYSKEKVTKRTRTVIAGKPLSYKVKSGDSLWLLARRFDTTVSEIKRINNLNCNKLNIGQIIKIRGGGSSARTSYTIKKGDNLYMIARKNNIKLEDLLELNNLSRKTKIYPGQIISIEK